MKYQVRIVDSLNAVIRTFIRSDNGMRSVITDVLNDEDVKKYISDDWDNFEVYAIEDEHF